MLRAKGITSFGAATLLVAATLLLGACATGSPAGIELDRQAKSFEIPAGRSVIYVYRRPRTLNASYFMQVTLDARFVGWIGTDNFLMRVVDPGPHAIDVEYRDTARLKAARLTVDAKPDARYFVQLDSESSFISTNKITQTLVADSVAQQDVVSARMVKWLD